MCDVSSCVYNQVIALLVLLTPIVLKTVLQFEGNDGSCLQPIVNMEVISKAAQSGCLLN